MGAVTNYAKDFIMVHKFVKSYRVILVWGFVVLPLFFWPGSPVPYEVPKAWFIGGWVAILSIVAAFSLVSNDFSLGKLNKKLAFWVLAFVAVSLVSSALGVDFHKSLWGNYYRVDGLSSLMYLMLLAYCISLFRKSIKRQELIKGILLGSLAVSSWSLLSGVRTNFAVPQAASFGNPNFLAGYLVVTTPFWIFKLTKAKGKRRRYWFIGLLFVLLAIFLTKSVGAIIALAVVLGAWLFLGPRKSGIVGVGLVVFALVAGGLWFYLHGGVTSAGAQIAPESRERIFRKVLLGWKQRPWLGWGVANVDYAFNAADWPIKVDTDVYVDKAHSLFLETLVTTGVAGLAVYLGLIIALAKAVYVGFAKTKKEEKLWYRTLLVVLVVYIFHTQTNVVSVAEDLIFWFVIGIV